MAAGQLIGAAHQAHRIEPLAIDGHRIAGFEVDLHDLGLGRGRVHRGGHRVHLLGRLHVGILQNSSLDAAAQQVQVDRIGGLLGDGHRNAAALAVGDRFLPAHAPFPGRGQHLEFGSQGANGHIEPNLVVALAGAAVGHGISSHLAGHLHQATGNQGPGQGGGEGVTALIESVGADRGKGELSDERFDQVTHDRLAGTGIEGLAADRLKLIPLAQVRGEGDHLVHTPLLQEVRDADTGVDTAGIGKHHLLGPWRGALCRRRHRCCSCVGASDCPP